MGNMTITRRTPWELADAKGSTNRDQTHQVLRNARDVSNYEIFGTPK